MATVSILIPAYKPDYLEKALISAQYQTFKDVEILIGDDTVDGRLRKIVERFDDPRIRYFHHGFRDGRRNSRQLWERATGKYVKWLYDDDILMPASVETLVAALDNNPTSVLAFHERVYIDDKETVVYVPPSLIGAGETALIDRHFLVENMVALANNFIGEPSNVMMVRDRVDFSLAMVYRAWNVVYLTDVVMYLNMAEHAPIVLVGGYLSCFRRHAAQCSNVASPIVAAGYYEWELMMRGEAAQGQISASGLIKGREQMKRVYSHGINNLGFGELKPLLENLEELTDHAPAGLFDSPRFRADVANARNLIVTRHNAANA